MLMSRQELEAAIAYIGCSGAQLARWLDVTGMTITNWRSGRYDIPGPAAVAIKALMTGWRP